MKYEQDACSIPPHKLHIPVMCFDSPALLPSLAACVRYQDDPEAFVDPEFPHDETSIGHCGDARRSDFDRFGRRTRAGDGCGAALDGIAWGQGIPDTAFHRFSNTRMNQLINEKLVPVNRGSNPKTDLMNDSIAANRAVETRFASSHQPCSRHKPKKPKDAWFLLK